MSSESGVVTPQVGSANAEGAHSVADSGEAAVDTWSAISAAAFLISLAQLIINLQPIILGALADAYGLSDRQLGHVSAIFVGSVALTTTTAPLWIRKVDWRITSYIAAVGAAGVLFIGSRLTTFLSILLLFAGVGVAKSLLYAPSFASLGDTKNPDRSYAVATAAQGVLAAITTALITSYFLPRFGVAGAFATLAAFLFAAVLICPWLPRRGPARFQSATAVPGEGAVTRGVLPAMLALLALGLFIAGILGFWYFSERIGAARGVAPALIGATLSFAAIASIAGAALVTWLGGRLASMVFVIAGTIIVIAGYLLMGIPGDAPYVIGTLLFAAGWGIAQPPYWSILRVVDVSNRIFVAAPVVTGVAGVIIGFAAGPVIEMLGYSGLLLVSGSLLVAGSIVGALANVLGTAAARAHQLQLQAS